MVAKRPQAVRGKKQKASFSLCGYITGFASTEKPGKAKFKQTQQREKHVFKLYVYYSLSISRLFLLVYVVHYGWSILQRNCHERFWSKSRGRFTVVGPRCLFLSRSVSKNTSRKSTKIHAARLFVQFIQIIVFWGSRCGRGCRFLNSLLRSLSKDDSEIFIWKYNFAFLQ